MLRSAAAHRYAQALLEIARGKGDAYVDRLAAQVRALGAVMGNPELAGPLQSPSRSDQDKAHIVVGALQASVRDLDPVVANLAVLLIARRRSRLAPQIADEFEALLNEARGVVNAEVITAVPLTDDQRQRLGGALSGSAGRRVSIQNRVDPGIMGGVIVRIGDRLIDSSVAGRLSALRRQLV